MKWYTYAGIGLGLLALGYLTFRSMESEERRMSRETYLGLLRAGLIDIQPGYDTPHDYRGNKPE